MKIVQINAVCGKGSTGKICTSVSQMLTERGIENYILYSSGKSDLPNAISCATPFYTKMQALKSRVFGNYGFNSVRETNRMIAELEKISPDIVHLHNLHGHDCHLGRLFAYFRKKKIKIFWTFHDCWAFTGYCPHYDMIGCDHWKSECQHCPQRKYYSFFFDRSKELFRRKKQLLEGLDLTIITPSQWLADQVKMSFLKDYPIRVINNGINLEIFQPSEGRDALPAEVWEKKIVLGVSFGWGERKGLDLFLRLASDLDSSYQIVLVGTDAETDKQLPKNIISIHRTGNQAELAKIYSSASVFVNPTREENFPTTNIEALACGTPVVTFRTGGSREMLTDQTGIAVAKNDYDGLLSAIQTVCEGDSYRREDCRAQALHYRDKDRFLDYIELYLERREEK